MSRGSEIIRGGILAGALTFSGLGAPHPAVAQDPTSSPAPENTEGMLLKTDGPLTEHALTPRPGLTPELLITMGGEALLGEFNSASGRKIEYERAPFEGEDGISPSTTTNFVNAYLETLPQPLTPEELTWERITTDISEDRGFYMTFSSSNSEKLNGIADPNTFGTTTIYQDGNVVANYMEYQIPNASLEFADEVGLLDALDSNVNIPVNEQMSARVTVLGFNFTENENGELVPQEEVPYMELVFMNGDDAAIALINPQGHVHLLETTPENLSNIVGFDVTSG
jgi:hypothetical protein